MAGCPLHVVLAAVADGTRIQALWYRHGREGEGIANVRVFLRVYVRPSPVHPRLPVAGFRFLRLDGCDAFCIFWRSDCN